MTHRDGTRDSDIVQVLDMATGYIRSPKINKMPGYWVIWLSLKITYFQNCVIINSSKKEAKEVQI